MKRIFCRGLNFHGQCGLGKDIQFIQDKFITLPISLPLKNIYTNLAHSFGLGEDQKSVYYWGFNWDIRSFFRTTAVFQMFPRLMWNFKKFWSPLKSYPMSPCLLHTFSENIIDIKVGGAHCLFLDKKGICFGLGDNSYGQIGKKESEAFFEPVKINLNEDKRFLKISAGFQHSIFLTTDGEVYGCGKSDKYQLGGETLNKYTNKSNLKEDGAGLQKINVSTIEGKVIDICAGKYHSVFLSDSGNVYTIGINRFGQLGQPNMNTTKSGVPIKLEFPKDVKIAQIKTGDSHNLMLTNNGELYSNGDNSIGQVDGELDNFLYYHCTPKRISFPDESPIKKIFAQNNRSAVILENGKSYYWGGLAYEPKCKFNKLPRYSGINIFNEEKGIPENSKISDLGLGYLHDIILV